MSLKRTSIKKRIEIHISRLWEFKERKAPSTIIKGEISVIKRLLKFVQN